MNERLKRSLQTRFSRILLLAPILVLSASYLLLAFKHTSWNLLNVIIHENGQYTLLQTIFYFEHAMRELPIDVCMSVCNALAFSWRSPLADGYRVDAYSQISKRFLALSLALSAFVAGASIYRSGWESTLMDLLQYRTRGDSIEYGSHWQYHLLHLIFYFFFTFSAIQLSRRFVLGYKIVNPATLKTIFFFLALTLFLTLALGPSLKPFSDPVYLAHEFREIVTHSLVTFSFAFAVLIQTEKKLLTANRVEASSPRLPIVASAVTLVIPLFIFYQLRGVHILSLAQKQASLLDLFASHFFEHVIDYFIITSLSVVFFLAIVRQVQDCNTRYLKSRTVG